VPTEPKVKRTSSQATGLTEEEKAAARETVRERKRQAKQGASREAGLKDVLEKIAEMPKSDRVMAERIHAIVLKTAPDLMPKTWYGMPAYANEDGKLICFFQSAEKFKARYATFGFEENAKIDDGTMWATSWALTKLTADDEKKIAALVKKAVG
jgi:uncharacterized protein YdhG (YjbR/CyaY superfamily)